MNHSPVALGGAVWILLCLGVSDARAELIQWSYSWSRSPAQVQADSPGTGTISLTDAGMKSAAGNSYLVAANLQAHSTAPNDNPDVFTNKKYTLSLSLGDQASGASGTLTFAGEFNGTLTANSSNITNTFLGTTTQTLALGEHLFTVTMDSFTGPGPTGADNSGSIAARAEVSVSTIMDLPEPSSLVLALAGAAGGLGLTGLNRRTRTRGNRQPEEKIAG
jgi:hypothetical protein